MALFSKPNKYLKQSTAPVSVALFLMAIGFLVFLIVEEGTRANQMAACAKLGLVANSHGQCTKDGR